MSIKYVVFDWDGTLADTYPVISAAYDYTFDTLGLPRIPYDEVKRITSTLQNKDTLGCIFGERKQEAADAYYSFIGKHHAAALEAMPGARSVLEYCRKHNITSVLITNKKTLYVAEEIEKLGFSEFLTRSLPPANMRKTSRTLWPRTPLLAGNFRRPTKYWFWATAKPIFKPRQPMRMTTESFCVIYDPKRKYKGSEPDRKIDDLRQVIEIIGECNG